MFNRAICNMMKTILILIATILLQVKSQNFKTHSMECILESTPTVRNFESLIEYQSNKISFDRNHYDFMGNFVTFDFETINKLVKNVFITYDSEHIISLDLARKGIQYIDNGAFTTLFCLHYLDLSGNNIADIRQDTFEGIEHLRRLNISNNKIKILTDFVFQRIPSIEILDISSNHIKATDSLALSNLENLEELYLGNNNMKYIPKILFWDLRKTRVLDLHANDFEHFLFKVFINMEALQTVDLSQNKLSDVKFFIKEANSMQKLDLSENSLTNLDVKTLKESLPSLTEINLNENQFRCSDLKFLIEKLKSSDINITRGRENNASIHQIESIFCENIVEELTTIESNSRAPANQTVEMQPPSEKTTKLPEHSSSNFILLLFCVIVGLGLLFVLDFFFASGSVFGACNRVSSRSYERFSSSSEEYVSLNRR